MSDDVGVSVVVAAFNAAPFIATAIRSALDQDAGLHEVIVVDDASTDATVAAVEALAREDGRVRLVRLDQNGGPSAARNTGIEVATGTWIAPLDADDAFEPGRLRRLLAHAAAHRADLVADDLAIFDAAAGVVVGHGLLAPLPDPAAPVTVAGYVRHNLADGVGFDWGLLKPMIRREVLTQHAIRYDPSSRHGEDFRLVFELLLGGARFHVLPEPLYRYTQRWGRVSGRASGMSRTTVGYAELADATRRLARDRRVEMVDSALPSLLTRRARGLQRQADRHFLSVSLRAGAAVPIMRRIFADPPFASVLARHLADVVGSRIKRVGGRLRRAPRRRQAGV